MRIYSGICIHEKGKIIECNQKLESLTGYTRNDLIGMEGYQLVSEEYVQVVAEKVRQDATSPYHVKGLRKDGSTYDLRLQGKTIPYQGRTVRVAEFRDVSERRRAQLALEESERKHRIIYENSPLGMIYFDSDGTILDCNDQFIELMGASRKTLIGFNTASQTAPSMQAAIKKALDGEQSLYEDLYTSVTGNKTTYLRVMFNPVTPGQAPSRVIATLEDISERKRAEMALRESAERIRTFFSAISDAVVVHPYQVEGFSRIIEVNDVACSRYGYSRDEFLQLNVGDITDKKDSANHASKEHRRLLLEHGNLVVETTHINKSGMRFPVEINANIIEQGGKPVILAVVRDISQRKEAELEREKLEGQLQQAQKMESIGRLAGGIAHDFNNMLGVILGRVELLMDDGEALIPYHEDLLEIQRAATRSATLTRQLLTFARKQTIAPQVVDINEKITETLRMLQRLIGESISLEWRPGHTAWKVSIDPGQVDQVLTNLCVNARDAITGSGTIVIRTFNTHIHDGYELKGEKVSAGAYVVLEVSDNGDGMNEEVQGQLFEPFFTTKKTGRGTGLGLATVYGIVRQNNGFINVKSMVGKGSTFYVFLPRCVDLPGAEETDTVPDQQSPEVDQTVLLVEDEPALLKMTEKMLFRIGYRVLVSPSPHDALEMARKHPGRIDLLLTDVIMPHMDGRELAAQIKELYPQIRTLFMSGYSDDIIAKEGKLAGDIRLIQKPFTKSQLSHTLKSL